MITAALLIYLGVKVGAEAWYFWVCGLIVGIKFIQFCVNLYSMGAKNNRKGEDIND